ncbi:MAG: hypothetical protein WA208_04285 [Thermoanaerobaculia bacterium]
MSRRYGIRLGSLIAALFAFLLLPFPASAQYTTQEKQDAVKAVAAYLRDVGESEAARLWEENWKRGHYSFADLPPETDAHVVAGNTNITFNEEMIRQLRREARPKRRTVGDWAATFMHEQAHTRQWKAAWTKSDLSHLRGGPHPLEAEAWGEGFKTYWKWLLRTNEKYQTARTDELKDKYAKEMVDLAASFRSYHANYVRGKLGPLPEDLRFEPLDGRYEAVPLTFEQAFREADRIIKKVGPTLHLAVRLNKTVYRVRPGERMAFEAHPENVWSPSSKKGSVTYRWKAGSKQLAETSASLTRDATVDETITVIVSDERSQKAEASCEVIVRGPPMPEEPTEETPAPKTATKPPAPVPVPKTPALPGQKDAKATPIKLDLDAKPTQVTRAGSFIAKTWGGTAMDTFRIGGGELTSASFSRSRGRVIYNVSGTFKPGQTVSLAVAGSQWDMSKAMVGLKHNRAKASIRFLDRSGKPIGEPIEHDSGESKSPSLSGSVSGSAPAAAATVIMEGHFVCTWASAYTTASETAGVKVTLTVAK